VNFALVGSAFLMGLLGSTHCAVMCGGVVGILSGGLVPLGKRPPARTSLQLAMSLGRIATYAAFGAMLGGLGAVLEALDTLRVVQVSLRFGAGLLMVGVGLYLSGIWRKFQAIERVGAPLWRRIEPYARRLVPVRSFPAAFGLGALWGFMPCGLVYGALGLSVATGSVLDGAGTMLAFGAGTLPMMLFVGAFAGFVAKLGSEAWIRRAAGLAIVVFGLVNVATASAQAGFGSAPGTQACCAPKKL